MEAGVGTNDTRPCREYSAGALRALIGSPPTHYPFSAPAKCAQLLVSIKHKQAEDQDQEGFQKVLHFGYVSVGSVAERQIRLLNPSAVCMHWEGIGKRERARFRDLPKPGYTYRSLFLPILRPKALRVSDS